MDESGLERLAWLAEKYRVDLEARGYSHHTIDGSRWHMKVLLDFLRDREEADVSAITRETLYRFQMHLYGWVAPRGKTLSVESQSTVLGTVRGFFRWLANRGHVMSDPAASLELPRTKKALPRGLMTEEEMRKVLRSPKTGTPMGLRDRAMLEVLYSTGIRNGELRNLSLYDVKVRRGEVMVREGKGRKDRVVPLGAAAGKWVERYVRESRPVIVRGRSAAGDCLFVAETGRPMDGTTVERVVKLHAARAGIRSNMTPHGIRHTCATHMLKGGASLRHIQALLGHKSLESTQVYTRVEVGDLKKVHERCHPRERGS